MTSKFCHDFCFICLSTYQLIIPYLHILFLHRRIFAVFLFLFCFVLFVFFFISIQIPIQFYEPDPVANQIKFDCAIARVRDFWAWRKRGWAGAGRGERKY